MSKELLTKKILCSVLAAGAFTFISGTQSEAAQVNGHKFDDGIIENSDLQEAGSAKFAIGQGNLTIDTNASVGKIISSIKTGSGLSGIYNALQPNGDSYPLVGAVGGDAGFDYVTNWQLNQMDTSTNDNLKNIVDKIKHINTMDNSNKKDDIKLNGDISLNVGKVNSPVIVGLVGGDLGISAKTQIYNPTYNITRNGNVNININKGHIIGGSGGSASVALGNIFIKQKVGIINFTMNTAGYVDTKINNVDTNVNGNSSISLFSNGGVALGLGGQAFSTVNGDTNLTINNETNNINVGIIGAGTAISSIGGDPENTNGGTLDVPSAIADSKVTGSSTVAINNSVVAGLVGGGMASAIDIGEQSLNYENITATTLGKGAGTATSKVEGNTNIKLDGKSTAVGVLGGSVAVSTTKETTYDEKTISKATANVGNTNVTIDVDNTNLDKGKLIEGVKSAKNVLGQLTNIVSGTTVDKDAIIDGLKDSVSNLQGQGAVIGVMGNGIAMATTPSYNTAETEDATVLSSASTKAKDVNIDLEKGYIVGAIANGVAMATNNATATADINNATINVAKDAEVVGIVGNGIAYYTGTSNGGRNQLNGTAKATAQDITMNINGNVDGIVAGGIALDDSQADVNNASVSEKSSTINVNEGSSVNKVNFNEGNGILPGDLDGYYGKISDSMKDVAILGGDIVAGGGANGTIQTANINIKGGTVNGDIVGGGVSVYGYAQKADQLVGATTTNSNITVDSGMVNGNIYAGGITDVGTAPGAQSQYNDAKATVENSIITINGGTVTGNINTGAVNDNENNIVKNSTVNLNGGTVNGEIIANAQTTNLNVKDSLKNKVQVNNTVNLGGDFTLGSEFTGTGTLNLVNGNISGKLNIGENITTNLSGAKYTTIDLTNDINISNGKLHLTDSGILETTANQVFTDGNTLDTVDNLKDNAVKQSASDKVSFEGGSVNITDKEYNLEFIQSATDAMKNHKYDDVNQSKTEIIMSGKLVIDQNDDTSDNIIDAGIIDQVTDGDDVVLDKVTVDAGNSSLNFSKDSSDSTPAITHNVSVGGLHLDDAGSNGKNEVNISDGINVTLGGSTGGELVTVGDNTGTKVDINIQSTQEESSALTIGNSLADENTQYHLNGNINLVGAENTESSLKINGNTTIEGTVKLDGAKLDVNTENGSLTVDTLQIENTKGNVTGAITADTLNLTNSQNGNSQSEAILNIGNEYNAGDLTVTNARLNGGTVFLDPVWNGNDTISDASAMAVVGGEATPITVDGKYIVGQNSILGFGVENTDTLRKIFADNFTKAGLTWGENNITAGLYVDKQIKLETGGSINVDGSLTIGNISSNENTNTINFGANSILVINGKNINGKTVAIDTSALTENNITASVADNSILYITNIEKGKTYKIFDSSVDAKWEAGNIKSDNALITIKQNEDGSYSSSLEKVKDIFGNDVVLSNIIDNTLEQKDAGDTAFDFFYGALQDKANATTAQKVAALNSLANMGELASVNHSTYSMSNVMTDAVADHITADKSVDSNLWARYIHNKEKIDGLALGNIKANYDATFDGIVVGSDLVKTDKATTGVAITYAEGDIKGNSLSARTENDANYYGLSVYHQIKNNDGSSVLGDVSYMHSSNDITQYNSGETITASPDADAFSIGVKAQQDINVGNGVVTPYAGLRYMHLGTGDYTNSLGMNYDVEDQNLWLLPVGVSYNTEIKNNDWTIRPMAEIGYVWTMGDRQTDQTVSLNGGYDTFGFDVADSGSFFGKLGIQAENDKVAYGLSYQYQNGASIDANQFMANVEFKF